MSLLRRFPGRGFVLEEVARGYAVEDVAAATERRSEIAENVVLDAYGTADRTP